MKLVIVVPDGMCDIRYRALENLSPAEYAHTPALDNIVRRGRMGLVRTMRDGLPLGSLVGLLGILGYNPSHYFPLGRSIFEAHALGLSIDPADVVFRCNIVNVSQDDELVDFTAGQIDDEAALQYLSALQLPAQAELHHDLSYRNVLIFRNDPITVTDLKLHEPHEVVGRTIDGLMPHYRGQPFAPLQEIIRASRRNDRLLWPWGASRTREFPKFQFGICVVTALSFLFGLTEMLGGQAIMPAGATGFLGSDLGGKVAALTHALPDVDIGIIHCNAPDEEGHIRNLQGKVQAIEKIDRRVILPLVDYLAASGQPYRILICPDHYTCCQDGRHHGDPVPYVVAGYGINRNHNFSTYSEAESTENIIPVLESHRLIPTLWPT
jgi:2,3-bisphosphoglycerate-independent phosphoglycerate mutase